MLEKERNLWVVISCHIRNWKFRDHIKEKKGYFSSLRIQKERSTIASFYLMNSVWHEKVKNILQIGIWMGDSGVNNWALTKLLALQVVDTLANEGIPILGGDVVELRDGKFRHTHDNWHINRRDFESKQKFLSSSIKITRNYIQGFDTYDRNVFFVLVPDDAE